MIIFTVLGIFTIIFFFVVILISIIERRIKNRTKEKLFWNMENLNKNRSYEEIQKQKK